MESKKHIPPRLAKRFLLWFLRDDLVEEVTGDLDEKFYGTLKNKSLFRAQLNYCYQVLQYMRPFAVRKSRPVHLNHYAMLENYFKIGWRNLVKKKGYSFINIGGLASGMAVAMLIGMWVHDEFTFNQYHRNYERIAQVMKGGNHEGTLYRGGLSLPYPLIQELKENYAGNFKYIVEAAQPWDFILSNGETKISRKGQFMGSDVPEMLSLEMERGDWNGLRDPHSILISSTTAQALFGDADPIGQSLKINTDLDVKVTGVYKDLPNSTKFSDIKFFAPFALSEMSNTWLREQPWDNHFLHIYCEINPNSTFEQVNANIRECEMKVIRNIASLKELAAEHPVIELLPMKAWHLYSDYKRSATRTTPSSAPVQFVWLVGTIGAFVLLLACINFMNLSTANSERRAKEVGIRKSVGSVRKQLMNQFFTESYMIVLLAFALAILLAAVTLPWFNDLAGKQLVMPWTAYWFWLSSIPFVLITGLLAGSYPALYLSSFNPVKVLKGTFRAGRLASIPRKVLVVTQFTISLTLIISTIVVYKQIVFAKNRPVGYTREGLIMIQKKTAESYKKVNELRNELKKTGVVEEVSEAGGKITSAWSTNGGFDWKGRNSAIEQDFHTLSVSTEYGKTVGWQFINGRDFSGEIASDSSGFVINETAAKYLGFANPAGETLHWKNRWWAVDKDFTILGVVKDMVMDSPYEPIRPTVFFMKSGGFGITNIKISAGASVSEALPKIEAVFRRVIPTEPFEYEFVDQDYALKFAAEERIARLASTFGVLAIFISCLGLFGLASFVAEQKTKEIGIRKVVGASVLNLWQMLSRDFIVLVLIGCALASVVAYFSLSSWLENFAYRADISWWIFAVTGAGAIIITLITVSYQALKAATMNPVKSLKSE